MRPRGLARLHGLFAAYKPPGLKWKHLRDTVELQLLKGVLTELTRCPLPVRAQVSMPGSRLPLNSVFASCWAPWKAAKRRS